MSLYNIKIFRRLERESIVIVRMQYKELLEAVTSRDMLTDSVLLRASLKEGTEMSDCPILLVCTQEELSDAIKHFGNNRTVVGYLIAGLIDFNVISNAMPAVSSRPLNVLLPYTYSSDTDTNLEGALNYLKANKGMADNVNVLVKLPSEYSNMQYVQSMCRTHSNVRYTGGKLINLLDCRIGAVINDDLFKKIAESNVPLVYTNDDCVSLVCEYRVIENKELVDKAIVSAKAPVVENEGDAERVVIEEVDSLEETNVEPITESAVVETATTTEEKAIDEKPVEPIKKTRKPRAKKAKAVKQTVETKPVVDASNADVVEDVVIEPTAEVKPNIADEGVNITTETVVEATEWDKGTIDVVEDVVVDTSAVETVEINNAESVVETAEVNAENAVETAEVNVESVPITKVVETLVVEAKPIEPTNSSIKSDNITETVIKAETVNDIKPATTDDSKYVKVETGIKPTKRESTKSEKGIKSKSPKTPKVTKQSIIAAKFTISDEF